MKISGDTFISVILQHRTVPMHRLGSNSTLCCSFSCLCFMLMTPKRESISFLSSFSCHCCLKKANCQKCAGWSVLAGSSPLTATFFLTLCVFCCRWLVSLSCIPAIFCSETKLPSLRLGECA